MRSVKAWYSKHPRALLLDMPGITSQGASKPTRETIQEDYAVVWEGELHDGATPDDVFVMLNQDMKLDLPQGIHHTSMSVGDVVQMARRPGGSFEDDHFYLCMPVGWESLESG